MTAEEELDSLRRAMAAQRENDAAAISKLCEKLELRRVELHKALERGDALERELYAAKQAAFCLPTYEARRLRNERDDAATAMMDAQRELRMSRLSEAALCDALLRAEAQRDEAIARAQRAEAWMDAMAHGARKAAQ